MRRPACQATLILLFLQSPASAQSSVPATEAASGAFARVEYWRCPEPGQAAFEDLIRTVWGPLFDQMVKEGKFTAWSAIAPVDAREVGFANGQTTLEPSTPRWNWVVTWHAVSRAALEEAWPEYHRRLEAASPGRPGPDTFCTRVRIVNHRVLR